MELTNYGAAPMYFDWPLCIYVLDEENRVISRYETDVRLSELSQGESAAVRVQMDLQGEAPAAAEKRHEQGTDMPLLAVGIENPETGEPEVYLDMDTAQAGMRYVLNP